MAVVAAVLLIFGASAGWAGLLVAVAIVGVFTGLYVALSGRRSWALIASRKIGLIVVIASVVVLFVGAGIAPQTKTTDAAKPGSAVTVHHVVASAASTPRSKPTPTPTPTPTPVVVDDVNSQAGAGAQSTLVSEGFAVQLVYADGTAVTDPTGLIVVDEVPAAGSSATLGSPVVLTLSQPVVAPAPPLAPAPAPAALQAPSHPAGATALCRDGSVSYSAHRSGTCSHHGGVAQWY